MSHHITVPCPLSPSLCQVASTFFIGDLLDGDLSSIQLCDRSVFLC